MKDGFIKIGAVTPEVRPADCEFNAKSITAAITDAYMRGVRVLVLPELCVTGCTCGDLFLQSTLLNGAQKALEQIIRATAALDIVCAVGVPIRANGKLRDCAAVFTKGSLVGIVPKRDVPPEDSRFFTEDFKPHIFTCTDYPDLSFAVEFGDELLSAASPSEYLAGCGANIILCLSAIPEAVGRAEQRRTLVSAQSTRLCCAYAVAGAGDGESTNDHVYSGHNIIAENGRILAESELFDNGLVTADIDLGFLAFERRRNAGFGSSSNAADIREFSLIPHETVLMRTFPRLPFVPEDTDSLKERCRLILRMQSAALSRRLTHVHASKAVVGLSGGLDSALALIVCAEAMLRMRRARSDVLAVTMPCFGTTDRTRNNAGKLAELIGAELRTVNIGESVSRHFEDIGHDPELHNTAYENAQARERTQVLMDIANDVNGLVVGTGDLSELALGWATFAGDHISMYGVNASLPKTLIRRIVAYYADNCGDDSLSEVLYDIIGTPVSPELLPAQGGEIAQKTEDAVGPYELHDFFLYYAVRRGYAPKKLFRAACLAFAGEYEPETVLKWMKVFFKRFFSQQFKRSCLPDGAGVGSVSLSPRGGWDMPSDAAGKLWLDEAESIIISEDVQDEHI